MSFIYNFNNSDKNHPPNLRETNSCHNCKYAENVHWGEDMSCGKYDYESNAPYDICDSWEEDK